jgi:hypothetical protein
MIFLNEAGTRGGRCEHWLSYHFWWTGDDTAKTRVLIVPLRFCCPALLLLIFETTNDYVRFHGKLFRLESLSSAPRLQADDPDSCWTITVSNSLSIGFIDHPDHPALAGHDPHRVLEMASVSLALKTFLVTSLLTQLPDPP